MAMRKYQRAAIKQKCINRDGNAKNFHKEWKEFHDKLVEERIAQGKIVKDSKPKKNRKHDDSMNGLKRTFQFRTMLNKAKAKIDAKEETNKVED